MEIIQHTLTWVRGELFEGKLVFAFGLLALLSGLLFWKIGSTPNVKAMLFPLLLVGLMFVGIGGGMLYSNPKRLVELPKAYEESPSTFLASEKARVENFTKWYPVTRYVMTGLAILGLFSFLGYAYWESHRNCFAVSGRRLIYGRPFFGGKGQTLLRTLNKLSRQIKA